MKEKIEEMGFSQFHWFAYLLSQYLWLVIPGLFFLFLIETPKTQTTKEFKSATAVNPWNSSLIPHYFAHVTDIHITESKNMYKANAKARLTKVTKLQPDKIIITGDVVDSYKNQSAYNYRGQVQEDWKAYQEVFDSIYQLYPPENIYIYPGNHDVYDLISINSSNAYGSKMMWSEKNYSFDRQNLTEDISLFEFNPYEFPTPNANMLWWAHTSKSFRKNLETKISDFSASIQFLATHSCTLLWYPKSYISKVIKNAPRSRLILTGHFHPDHPILYHHGDTLEVVGQPLFKKPSCGIITVDNTRVFYHECNLSNTFHGFITNPIPINQTSSYEIFNEKHTDIRALIFYEGDFSKLKINTIGDVNADLQCSSVPDKKHVYLCSAPMDLEYGNYTISLRNGTTVLESINFTIGDTIKPFKEDVYNIEKSEEFVYLATIFGIIIVVYTIPDFLSMFKEGRTSEIQKWIEGANENGSILKAIIYGPILVKHRLSKLPSYHQFLLFICSIWIFVGPYMFPNDDDEIIIVWLYGYVANWKSCFSFYGFKYTLNYITYILVPAILLSSSIGGTYWSHWVSFIDCAIYALFFVGVVKTLKQMIHENGYIATLSGTMSFMLDPLLLIFNILLGFSQNKKFGDHESKSNRRSQSFSEPLIKNEKV